MTNFLLQVVAETWFILKEASIFLLFGFALAGVLAVLVPAKTMMRFFGRGKVKSVLWASAIGVPLPLCSCGVLPTALGLRRQGATKGATVSFLISTPETGVDSISLSYALMDPIITVFRPLAAVITAVAAGLATNFLGESRSDKKSDTEDLGTALPEQSAERDASGQAPDHGNPDHTHDHAHDYFESHGAEKTMVARAGKTPGQMIRSTTAAIHQYAFRELLDETSHWLVLGIILSGVIGAALPETFFEQYLSGDFTSMFVMLLIGIPIYTCASSSTPIAAAFVLKGLNPGAALVFLLAGPATNIGSITVLLKFLGLRVVAIYLATIIVVSLMAGYALNWVYQAWGIDPLATFGTATTFIPESLKIASAIALFAMLVFSMLRTHLPEEWFWVRDRLANLSGLYVTLPRLRFGVAAAVISLWLSSGFFAVQPGDIGVQKRFGEIIAPALQPGVHYRLPWPIDSHVNVQRDLVRRVELGFRSAQDGNLSKRALARGSLTIGGPSNVVPQAIKSTGFWFQMQTVAEESFLLTGDGNLLDTRFIVQYRVRDPIAFTFDISEPEVLVRSAAQSVLRSVVGTHKIDAIFTTGRRAIERQVMHATQKLIDEYQAGIEILVVRLLYVHPPEEVHDAFRDIASAEEDKLRTMNRAETFAVGTVYRARGEAKTMIEKALTYKHERVQRAHGDADGFSLKAAAYWDAPELTMFRLQMETVEEVLPNVQKFVRPSARELNDFDLWLREPFKK